MNKEQATNVLIALATEVLSYEYFTKLPEANKHAEALTIISGKKYEVSSQDEKYWVVAKESGQ